MDKCPFCGYELEQIADDTYYYSCGTWRDATESVRQNKCYEIQLAALKDMVWDLGNSLALYAGENHVILQRPEVKAIMEGE